MSTYLSLFVLFAGLSIGKGPQPSWMQVTSRDAGFTVAVPCAPTALPTQTLQTGHALLYLHYWKVEKRPLLYLVSYGDAATGRLPESLPPDALAPLFRAARDRILKEWHGRLVSERKLSPNGHQGDEILVETPEGLVLHMRTYAVMLRASLHIYQIIAVSRKQDASSPDAARFLS